jgi:UDP-N-acetylmuramoyl-L-alanyl-D-glutamate--2,6-diaminopimelate ligase
VVRGVRDAGHRRWTIEVDRRAAIAHAIGAARAADIVLIAGKGHETYQESQGKRAPFSDAQEAAAALGQWGAA